MVGIVPAYGFAYMDRATVSRRLKAARWLAGTGRNDRGQVVPVMAAELAELEPLVQNRLSKSRIEEIEQERTDARPMELRVIEDALGLPTGWFDDPLGGDRENRLLDRLEAILATTPELGDPGEELERELAEAAEQDDTHADSTASPARAADGRRR